MKNEAFGRLEPSLVQLFIHRLMLMAIGNKALLSNDLVIDIVFVSPEDPIKPIVRFHKDFIDLRKSNLYIKKLIQ